MKELQDVARRIREHSGLVYKADIQVVVDTAQALSEHNATLIAQVGILEMQIESLTESKLKVEEELAHVNMLFDAQAKLVQDLKDELCQYKDGESPPDEFEKVVLGEME